MVLYEKPLHIEVVGTNLLVNGQHHHKSVRLLGQMKRTLMNPVEGNLNPEMYYMFRNVYLTHDIRYDITLILPIDINGECAKTYGHYHPATENGLAYPEVYQVLKGEAVFLLQKPNKNGSVDTILIHAKEKEVLLMPPGYGHVSINPGEEVLVLSNVVYDKFESIYSDFEDNRGGAYYYLKGGEVVQNSNYIVQRNERLTTQQLNERYKFSCNDILKEFHDHPKQFEFLAKPELLGK
ncbi:Glucose-6-phosphate isomerase [Candidatus Bilamarchaeum dharawalense]|uniref:glucose-6-phosphate isomerase n=1 Tax=Candidatus Bilamarchaeum dharawalense TaxID=2885759 RepID=A0A5E4LSE7_9ARCH|nr:Glucose-6-phosphate isomerase [Candidatus Bilamarchaeum dharawalense]